MTAPDAAPPADDAGRDPARGARMLDQYLREPNPGEAAAIEAQLEPWVWDLVAGGDSRPYRPHLAALLARDLTPHPTVALLAAHVLHDSDPGDRSGRTRDRVDRLLAGAGERVRQRGDVRGECLVAWVVGGVAIHRGDVDTAAQAWRRASELSHPGAPEAVVGLIQSIAAGFLVDGDVRRATEQMSVAERIAARIGAERASAMASAHRASLDAHAGRFVSADVAIRRSLDGFASLDGRELLGDVILALTIDGVLGAFAGDRQRAEASFLRALVRAGSSEPTWFAAVVRCSRAEYLAPVDPARAHDDARWAQRVFLDAGDEFFGQRALRARARAALASNEAEAAIALVRPLLDADLNPLERARACVIGASTELVLGDRRAAEQLAGEAAALGASVGATALEVAALLLQAEADPARHAREVRRARSLSGADASWRHLWAAWPTVRVEQLGTQRVLLDDVPATFRTEAAHQLVHSLVLAGPHGVTVGELQHRFWPGSGEARATSSLSTTLGHVRAALGKEAWRVERRGGIVRLDLTGLDIDYRAARDGALEPGPMAIEALRALRAPLLPAWRAERWVQQADADRERLLQLLGTSDGPGFGDA